MERYYLTKLINKKMTLKKFAELEGVTYSQMKYYISNYENGKFYSVPQKIRDKFDKIARTY